MSSVEAAYVLGIDIGGTFTDVAALDVRDSTVNVAKAPTTPHSFVQGVLAAVDKLGIELTQVERIIHGSTTATNALIERKHARVGFIGTKGFTDEFDIQRMARRWSESPWADTYDLHQKKPEPFIPRSMRREVDERVLYNGTIYTPLDANELESSVFELIDKGAEAIAICFLWSTSNPEHEQKAKRIAQLASGSRSVSVSVEVCPVIREYERMVTTAVNASLMPVMALYLEHIECQLEERGFDGDLFLMQSHGGTARPGALKERPIHTLRGGPVGGAVATALLARRVNRRRVVSCDVGGTSCDTAVILDFEVPIADGTEVDYYPIQIPTADIRCIGAGGGSIAGVDVGGALRVGPASAGSIPGPACYRRGGVSPTLTDANVVLGRLLPNIASLPLPLDVEAARSCFDQLCQELGLDLLRAASGVVRVAVANMAESIRLQTVDRGYDPREFSLIAFGGAGPLHATQVAEACSIREVIIPVAPGVFSSLGMVGADQSHYGQQGYLTPLDKADSGELEERFRVLESEACVALRSSPHELRFHRSAAMRYALQEWEIRVLLPQGEIAGSVLAELGSRFHDAHRSRHGFAREEKPVEFVTLYLKATRPAPEMRNEKCSEIESFLATPKRTVDVFVDEEEGLKEIPAYERDTLQSGAEILGPAIITERTATTYLHSDRWKAVIDALANVHIATHM